MEYGAAVNDTVASNSPEDVLWADALAQTMASRETERMLLINLSMCLLLCVPTGEHHLSVGKDSKKVKIKEKNKFLFTVNS